MGFYLTTTAEMLNMRCGCWLIFCSGSPCKRILSNYWLNTNYNKMHFLNKYAYFLKWINNSNYTRILNILLLCRNSSEISSPFILNWIGKFKRWIILSSSFEKIIFLISLKKFYLFMTVANLSFSLIWMNNSLLY